MFFILMSEVLFWVGLVQTWKYRGKAKESVITNGENHELTKLYEQRRTNWSIVSWVCLGFQFLIMFI